MFTSLGKKVLAHVRQSEDHMAAYLGGALIILTGALGYGYYQLTLLSGQVARLESEFASTTALLQGSISDATTSLSTALEERTQSVREQIDNVYDEVGDISGTVSDLEKLTKTDPELLAKYSKVFFLSENYAPARLVDIPAEYKYNANKDLQILPEVLPRLRKMLDAAKEDGIDIYVASAFRSFNTQEALKGQYTFTYGAGTANTFSADQGYSEHQLGTAVDLITTGTGGQLSGFDKTPAYAWLLKNAYRYGFVLSYPESNGYYVFEPWHWRFVGRELATDLHDTGEYFYQMDQREIDKYLVSLFD